jgi:hypothetical protein
MTALRNLSPRPEILVDNQGPPLVDPTSNEVGIPSPLGRGRSVTALPLNDGRSGPVQLAPALILHDSELFYLADPDGNVIGTPGLWVHRMVAARWVANTRRR